MRALIGIAVVGGAAIGAGLYIVHTTLGLTNAFFLLYAVTLL